MLMLQLFKNAILSLARPAARGFFARLRVKKKKGQKSMYFLPPIACATATNFHGISSDLDSRAASEARERAAYGRPAVRGQDSYVLSSADRPSGGSFCFAALAVWKFVAVAVLKNYRNTISDTAQYGPRRFNLRFSFGPVKLARIDERRSREQGGMSVPVYRLVCRDWRSAPGL